MVRQTNLVKKGRTVVSAQCRFLLGRGLRTTPRRPIAGLPVWGVAGDLWSGRVERSGDRSTTCGSVLILAQNPEEGVAMRALFLMVFAAGVALVTGGPMSAAEEELGTVEGTVTYQGKPLTDATITFHLKDDQFVGAKIKKEGKYRLDRVPAGTVKVTVDSKKVRIPDKYTTEETSGLSVEIKKGKNTVNFDLTS
jgi:hypothetical protein